MGSRYCLNLRSCSNTTLVFDRRLSNSISDHAIEIDAPEFERRAREYSVAEFESFYGSDAFRDNYSYDEERRLINYVPIAA